MITSINGLHVATPQRLPRVQKPLRFSVDTSSKRGMVKEKETAVVTKDIIPIPWNVLRQSKILELWLALSATWYLFS